MDYKNVASEILSKVGGKENISHLQHCSTRLRFTLHDTKKVDVSAIEKIDGVVGVRNNVQLQVIIGNEVNEVYAELMKLIGDAPSSQMTSPSGEKSSFGQYS